MPERTYPRIIISGVRGGSGKTTVSLAIISNLIRKGLRVIPFKKGPDYIDTAWLSFFAKNPCYNLDPFMIPEDRIIHSFIRHFSGDIAVIEGNRGIHDGMDATGSMSTARLAKLLDAPVILVVDCTKITRTVAAIVLGCMNLDRDVMIRGVILNQVSSRRHESVIKESIERYCTIPVLGSIPRLPLNEIPERHMGLTPFFEFQDVERIVVSMERLGEYIDIDEILRIAQDVKPLGSVEIKERMARDINDMDVAIGIVRDSAFQFYYEENIETLKDMGARIVEINALRDRSLPDIDCLYIGGGFPETNAVRLADNREFIDSLRKNIEAGLPVYAECGGMMYLGRSIIIGDKRYPMAGVIPVDFKINPSPVAHGYTIVEVSGENPFYPQGAVIRGHEFHYSGEIGSDELRMCFTMKRGKGIRNNMDGIVYKNVLATYTHVHAYGTPEWTEGMLRIAGRYRTQRILRKQG